MQAMTSIVRCILKTWIWILFILGRVNPRADEKHRLLYAVTDAGLTITTCCGHLDCFTYQHPKNTIKHKITIKFFAKFIRACQATSDAFLFKNSGLLKGDLRKIFHFFHLRPLRKKTCSSGSFSPISKITVFSHLS